jgi:hypothetical protein
LRYHGRGARMHIPIHLARAFDMQRQHDVPAEELFQSE